MHMLNRDRQVPIYNLEPDELGGNKNFRMYNFEGAIPIMSDLLIPHRKDHYLIGFIRKANTRHWVDMVPYAVKNNTIYFTSPGQIIVKEGTDPLWSTGIAFTKQFLSYQDASLSKLPLIQNPHNGHELLLAPEDIIFVEDIIDKLNAEYVKPGEWQQPMLGAYLSVLLTYLSRLYTEQFKTADVSAEKLLLKNFHSKIDERFHELHEVGDYANLLNISAGHLSEVVKMQSGKPAIKHIHERLVLEARRLLFHTDNALKEIAFELRFTDASYFNRFFKRETGVTPAEYRTNIRKMYH